MQRIFGVGLNKTGTTSLHEAVKILGFRSLHHGARIDRNIERAVAAGKPLLRYSRPRVRRAHAFFDLRSIIDHFDVADRCYPGSRFILSTRDRDAWIDSREKHVLRNQQRAATGEYQGSFLVVDRPAWIDEWKAHHQRVLTYFEGRDDLLTIDVTAGDGWDELAPFLGRPVPDVPFPRANVTRS